MVANTGIFIEYLREKTNFPQLFIGYLKAKTFISLLLPFLNFIWELSKGNPLYFNTTSVAPYPNFSL